MEKVEDLQHKLETTRISFIENEDGILLVKLYRPQKLNAFNNVMAEELTRIFTRVVPNDDRIKVVIVTGEGRAFCAGADLKAFSSLGTEEERQSWRDPGGKFTMAIHNCKKPVIAAVNGAAVGIGATMLLPMEIRIAAEDAKIGFVFVKRGLCPEACSTFFLPRIVGASKAAEWLYTGRIWEAKEEKACGFFTSVVPKSQVMESALKIAREITQNAPVSVSTAKRLLWRGISSSTPLEAHLAESSSFAFLAGKPDSEEGIRSFLEKRKPRFTMSVNKDSPPVLDSPPRPKL